MEPAREPAWAEHEVGAAHVCRRPIAPPPPLMMAPQKVFLLAEILKAAPVPSHVLYNLIRDSNIQPRWNDILLPHGRCNPMPFPRRCPRSRPPRPPHVKLTACPNLAAADATAGRSVRSCQMAYNDLVATYSAPDYRRPPLPNPIIYNPGPDIPKKRPHQPEAAPIGRLLQPRPPQSYPGEYVSGPAYAATAMSPVGEPASKKKRGRPTKAEAQQRAQEAAARGEPYPPPRKSRASAAAAEPPHAESRAHAHTPPGAVPGAAGAMTPQHTQPEHGSESSSGKKKRGKPTPLELEKAQRAPSETDSPLVFGSATDPNRSQAYSSFTPISAPLPSSTEPRDVRMEGVEETQPRTTTPRSFKDTVGI